MQKKHLLITIAFFLFASNSFGQQAIPKPSADKINQQSVTETIKFLASDELAGRDTPSPGLDKASDFVAMRFKKAGLEPLGTNGSFFHTITKATAQSPRSATVSNAGQPLKTLGVLSANETQFKYAGPVTLFDGKQSPDRKLNGPVTLVAPPFNQRSSSDRFTTLLKQLITNGATAILIQVSRKHQLISRSFHASQLHLADEFKGITGPMILIPKT